MKLILTRHGETEENIKGIIQGHMPGKLSENGIQQAKKLAERLKNEKIDAIYSSDLKRAVDTAKEIAKYHPNTSLILTEKLRERNHGSLTGKNKSDIDWDNYVPDGETPENMYKRINEILDTAFLKYKKGVVVFVAHGAISRMIINCIMNHPINDWDSIKGLKNTSISIFEIKQDKKHKVQLLNCTKHLNMPTHEQCIQWYKEIKTPDNIIKHVEKVNKVATYLAKKLIEKGININYDLVDKASLLHDLDKWHCINDPKIKHGLLTEKILTEKGFPEIGKYAKNHIPSQLFHKEPSWEEKLIVYADSRVLYDTIVSQQHRVIDALERYNIPEEIREKEIAFGKKCEKDIFSKLDIKPEDLEKLNN